MRQRPAATVMADPLHEDPALAGSDPAAAGSSGLPGPFQPLWRGVLTARAPGVAGVRLALKRAFAGIVIVWLAPPGHYLLFVLTQLGVPGVAPFLRIDASTSLVFADGFESGNLSAWQ